MRARRTVVLCGWQAPPGFTVHVKNGDRVRAGDPLIDFDRGTITKAGYSLVTPVVVSNAGKSGGVTDVAPGSVVAGEPLFTVVPKAAVERATVNS